MQSEINKKINPHVESSGSLFPVPSAPGPLAQQLLRTAEARSKLPPTCHCAGKELRVRVKKLGSILCTVPMRKWGQHLKLNNKNPGPHHFLSPASTAGCLMQP